LHNIYLYILSF